MQGVIVAMMTKDRAHMHLDTVFTLLDRDIATAFPKVCNNIRAISLRPGKKAGDLHVTEEQSFLSAVADALKIKKLNVVETGGDAYQITRGLLSALNGSDYGSCVAQGIFGTAYDDPSTPGLATSLQTTRWLMPAFGPTGA